MNDSEGYRDGTAYLLGIAGATARRHWTGMLAELDVTPSQFKVIMALTEAGPRGQRELADMVDIDPRNCVPIIDSLVEREMLSREIDSTDRRRRVLALTSSGRKLARKLSAVNGKVETDLLDRLSSEERMALRRILTQILAAATRST
ncbi:MAG: MarR family transcriptional regulator [Solirubrobacteraceae bacterium]